MEPKKKVVKKEIAITPPAVVKKLIKKVQKEEQKISVPNTVISGKKQGNVALSEQQRREELYAKLPQLFKPGQSGNPNGRPAGRKSWTTLVRERLLSIKDPKTGMMLEDLVVSKIAEHASQGNIRMIELIWAYIDGKPNQPMSHTIDNELDAEERAALDALLDKNTKK